MITEKELFEIGWKRFDDDENDPYYMVILNPTVFNLHSLSGQFDDNGEFVLWSIQNRRFTDINQIIELFSINQFEINNTVMEHYGTNIPLDNTIIS